MEERYPERALPLRHGARALMLGIVVALPLISLLNDGGGVEVMLAFDCLLLAHAGSTFFLERRAASMVIVDGGTHRVTIARGEEQVVLPVSALRIQFGGMFVESLIGEAYWLVIDDDDSRYLVIRDLGCQGRLFARLVGLGVWAGGK